MSPLRGAFTVADDHCDATLPFRAPVESEWYDSALLIPLGSGDTPRAHCEDVTTKMRHFPRSCSVVPSRDVPSAHLGSHQPAPRHPLALHLL